MQKTIDELEKIAKAQPERKALPVTQLSGFLGSGKTTLLKQILKNKEGMRVAVIVNDMAELNIDAELVKNTGLVQVQEEMIQFENGCICCTLREDLLKEIAKLARKDEFDYQVIESTGISEPIQVAETFAFTMDPDSDEVLNKLAKLDTCVTVVDTNSFFSYFNTIDTVVDRYKDADKADNRTITELMIDQLEFADVVIMNKQDLVKDKKVLKKIKDVITKLNPNAFVYGTINSVIPMKHIINTGKFDFEKASQMDKWMERERYDIQPETEEYNITSFIYRSKKPFDSKKIHDKVMAHYFTTLIYAETPGVNYDDEEEDPHNHNNMLEGEGEDEDEEGEEGEEEEDVAYNREEIAETYGYYKDSPWGNVYRSKGMIYVSTQGHGMFTWQTAGIINEVKYIGKWESELKKEKEPSKEVEDVRKNELVIIGTDLDHKAITKQLDDCLISDEEYISFKLGDSLAFENDPFRPNEDPDAEDEDKDEEETKETEEAKEE